MKKFGWIILILVVVFLFPKPYISTPGYGNNYPHSFQKPKKQCFGFASTPINAKQMFEHFKSGKSLCFGWIY